MSDRLRAPSLDDLRRHLEDGPSLLLATRDAALRADLARCSAACLLSDGTVMVAVNMPEGSEAIENVRANGRVAFTAMRPMTYRCLQVKGSAARVEVWPDQARALANHRRIFVDQMVKAGLPATHADAVLSTDCIAVAFTAELILNQTPGANIERGRSP